MPAAKPMFLLKTEPGTYSWDDLEREGRTAWDGVRNATAQINLKKIKPGDTLLIYHSGDQRAVVGVARAVGEPRPDPTDEKRKAFCVDIEKVHKLSKPIPLADFKARFPGFDLVRISRLSVMAVPDDVQAFLKPLLG